MAKRPVKKTVKSASKVAPSKKPKWTCVGRPPESTKTPEKCDKDTVYMRRNRKTGAEEHWCAKHWVKHVEGPNSEAYKDHKPAAVKKRRRVAKKVVKKK